MTDTPDYDSENTEGGRHCSVTQKISGTITTAPRPRLADPDDPPERRHDPDGHPGPVVDTQHVPRPVQNVHGEHRPRASGFSRSAENRCGQAGRGGLHRRRIEVDHGPHIVSGTGPLHPWSAAENDGSSGDPETNEEQKCLRIFSLDTLRRLNDCFH